MARGHKLEAYLPALLLKVTKPLTFDRVPFNRRAWIQDAAPFPKKKNGRNEKITLPSVVP